MGKMRKGGRCLGCSGSGHKVVAACSGLVAAGSWLSQRSIPRQAMQASLVYTPSPQSPSPRPPATTSTVPALQTSTTPLHLSPIRSISLGWMFGVLLLLVPAWTAASIKEGNAPPLAGRAPASILLFFSNQKQHIGMHA